MALYPKAEIPTNIFSWENIIFEVISQDENFKSHFAFYFLALKTLFLTPKIGQNNPEIASLEFESHCFLKNHVFLSTQQAGANIC